MLLTVKNLKKTFTVRRGLFELKKKVTAVDDISFAINEGETFGLVGESGCGKSTTARLILKLIAADNGEVFFEEKNIFKLLKSELKKFRRKAQIIFQDPYNSLNPRLSIRSALAEPLEIHKIVGRKEKEKRIDELLNLVGLSSEDKKKFPREFSGGQRQRIGIARSLAVNPKFIICDEPVSSLDVSIQAQIINLLIELQEKLKLTYLFITHDLALLNQIAQRIAVMYLGKIVEIGNVETIINNPCHPYTKILISSIPQPNPKEKQKGQPLAGEPPSALNIPSGCRFHTRCPIAQFPKCSEEEPILREINSSHQTACHFC
jgi:oligopeptide/dipeptide ABC transporter ATP-binding protein